MDKPTVIKILEETAILLELAGENPFKSRAYTNAARTLESDPRSVEELVQSGELKNMKGIGAKISERIREMVQEGACTYYEELKASFPSTLFDMLRVQGMGPKKVRILYKELGLDSLGALEYACRENRLLTLPGFGAKTQDKILDGIERLKKFQERQHLDVALFQANNLAEYMRENPHVKELKIAGSIRRRRETIKDIDLLATSESPADLMKHFVDYPERETIIGQGETKSSITLKTGMNADLRVVSDIQFPYALHHFTGSREHNTEMRGRAKRLGLKMNEYGLFTEDEKTIPCIDEKELFDKLGLQFIPPELRENTGEVQAAEQHGIPQVIEAGDIKGVLHVHSVYSDGKMTLAEIASIAQTLGYEYAGITEHSQSAKYAHGLEPERVRQQAQEIDDLNSQLPDFQFLKGIEVDILKDGRLDFNDEILSSFDFVIASVHSNFTMTESEMTERILTALSNPFVSILGHPTGRLLLARDPYALNLEQIIQYCAENNICIEINANPHRLDLDWRHCKRAKELGVPIAICPDIHYPEGFGDMEFGLDVARRGWLEKNDVINTKGFQEIRQWLEKQRKRNV